jgi:hypothetical protein
MSFYTYSFWCACKPLTSQRTESTLDCKITLRTVVKVRKAAKMNCQNKHTLGKHPCAQEVCIPVGASKRDAYMNDLRRTHVAYTCFARRYKRSVKQKINFEKLLCTFHVYFPTCSVLNTNAELRSGEQENYKIRKFIWRANTEELADNCIQYTRQDIIWE